MNPVREAAKPELYYGILHVPAERRHDYFIAVGPMKALQGLKEEAYRDKSLKGELVCIRKISEFPDKMAQGLQTHYENRNPAGSRPAAACCGRMRFRIHSKDGKLVAVSGRYFPKKYIAGTQPGAPSVPGGGKVVHGINAAFFEADCLGHLKETERITHAAATDGWSRSQGFRYIGSDSGSRVNQLKVRGLNPDKIAPIDEWIEKLRSVPDYSRTRKKSWKEKLEKIIGKG
jgi:hypothetical protein